MDDFEMLHRRASKGAIKLVLGLTERQRQSTQQISANFGQYGLPIQQRGLDVGQGIGPLIGSLQSGPGGAAGVLLEGFALGTHIEAARSLVRAMLEVHEATTKNPSLVAQDYFKRFKPGVTVPELVEMLSALFYTHHPIGEPLMAELVKSIDDLKLVKVFKPSLDSAKLAAKISANILS
jgi:hypothetical protein